MILSGLVFAASSTPIPEKKLFETNDMLSVQFPQSASYEIKDGNKLYFNEPVKEVYLHYFSGGSETRQTLYKVGRIDVWPKFEMLVFDNTSQSTMVVLKDKRTTVQTAVRFRAVFYETSVSSAAPAQDSPVTTPSAVCPFVYGFKKDGAIAGFRLSDNGTAKDLKTVVFGETDAVDYTLLWPSGESTVKKFNVKRIELLTATQGNAKKEVSDTKTSYSFASPVIILVTPENGKQFVAAVKKMTFSSKSSVEKAFQFGAPDVGNVKTEYTTGALAVQSREKPFSFNLVEDQRVSSFDWDPSSASCYPVFVEGAEKPVWVRDLSWESAPSYAGSRAGNAQGCAAQLGRCITETTANLYKLKFSSETKVTLVSCNVLQDNPVAKAKLGEVEFDLVALFDKKPEFVFDGAKFEFKYSFRQGNAKDFGINNGVWHVVYDPAAFDYYHSLNKNGGVPSAVPRHEDEAYAPQNHYCPSAGVNSYTLMNSGDYLARMWIAGTQGDLVLSESLVRLVHSPSTFGQFLLAHRSSDVVQENFQFRTNYVEARNAPKALLFNNLLYSVFSLSPATSSSAAGFLASVKDAATNNAVLDVVNPGAFGSVGKISLRNVFYTGYKISLKSKDDKFEGVAFTILQPKSAGAPGADCESSFFNPSAQSSKKCFDAAPFCWGYLSGSGTPFGNYRCYPVSAGNGYPAADAYACKGTVYSDLNAQTREHGTVYLKYAEGKGHCSNNQRAEELIKDGSCKKTPLENISYVVTKDGKEMTYKVKVLDCSARYSDANAGGAGGRDRPPAAGTGRASIPALESSGGLSVKTPAQKVKECRSQGAGFDCRNVNACDPASIKRGLCPGGDDNVCCKAKGQDSEKCETLPVSECKKQPSCEVKSSGGVDSCVPKASSSETCETLSPSECRKNSKCVVIPTTTYGNACISKSNAPSCSSIGVSRCSSYEYCEVIDTTYGKACVEKSAATPKPPKTWNLPDGKTCSDILKQQDCVKYYQCDWTRDQYGVWSCDVKAGNARDSCEAVGGWSCNAASACVPSTADKRGAGTCPYGTVCCQPLKSLPSGETCYSISPSLCLQYRSCELIDASFYGKACVPKTAPKGSLFLPASKSCSSISETDCLKYVECTLQYKFGTSICVTKTGYWKLPAGKTCSSISNSECNYYSKCKLASTVGGTFCQEK
ncbi:MAG: hypothetical protein QXR53_01300 [Candidatus Norongarragalinales archaeon]